VAASSGIPDVPHAVQDVATPDDDDDEVDDDDDADDDDDEECTEGSGVGFKSEPPVLSANDRAEVWMIIDAYVIIILQVAFVAELVRGVDVGWSGRLLDRGRTLLLRVPVGALPDGSKELFVRVLEYAEEALGCERVLVRFSKACPDRALVIRTFMYFGFSLLAPDMTMPIGIDDEGEGCSDSIVMVYKFD
jgi:ornithine decarboxylase antizyme 1